MRRILLEVALETVADAIEAEAARADRIEICAALELGGLTPTPGQVEAIRAVTQIPMVLMLRPRGGNFVYTTHEWKQIFRDLEQLKPFQPIGFVVGGLNADGTIQEPPLKDVIAQADGIPVVFHRAFDRTPHHLRSLDTLVEHKVTRVLTSGGEGTALAGTPRIAKLINHVGSKLQILPCGRITAKDAPEIIQLTHAKQLHGSFSRLLPDSEGLGYRGYAARYGTDREAIRATRAALASLGF